MAFIFFRAVIIFATLIATLASQAAPLQPSPSMPNDDVKSRINNGYSLSPIVGYDPTYGVLVGGAVFRGVVLPPSSNGSVLLYGSFNKNVELELHYKLWDANRTFYNVDATFANFFDPYYGEGDRTDPNGRINIKNFNVSVNPSFNFRFNHQFTLSAVAWIRYRDENGTEENAGQRVFGSEFRPSFGTILSYDDRDNQIDTHRGYYGALTLDASPAAFSTQSSAADFVRAEADVRWFTQPESWLVLAAQARGGTGVGDAGYLYRFTLGGSDTLRGYPSDRFRGAIYYLTQIEGRFTVLPWLSLATFASAGDIANHTVSDLNGPLFTKGFGFRIGLPPDYVAKARLDFGFASDQQSVYLSFNEAF